MTKRYLVKECHYTEKFDGEGFRIFKADTREDVREQILDELRYGEPAISYPIKLLCGTDFVEFANEWELLENLEIEEISEHAYDILFTLFPESAERGYGLPTVLF